MFVKPDPAATQEGEYDNGWCQAANARGAKEIFSCLLTAADSACGPVKPQTITSETRLTKVAVETW